MAHQKIIDSVKKQGQVTIKDLDEFLRFVINEYDMRTLNNNYISILIPMQLDVNNVFGLDVCKRSDDDYVILYSSAASFSSVSGNGYAHASFASSSYGVRPAFKLKNH